MICLDLGCGNNKIKLDTHIVIGIDCRGEVCPDIICNINKLPFSDETVDIIYSCHALEHFGRNEIFKILFEWKRVLKKGGLFWVIVPDLKWAAQRILREDTKIKNTLDDEDTVLSVIYGDQTY